MRRDLDISAAIAITVQPVCAEQWESFSDSGRRALACWG
jgi:hypothetical protein